MIVRASLPNEQPMQASKWLDLQALLDVDEMSLLLDDLGSPYLFLTGCVCREEDASVPKIKFLEVYSHYIAALKDGKLPNEQEVRPYFSGVLTTTPEALYAINVEGGRQILRVARPAVQMQMHRLGYSTADGKFRAMAFGINSVFWGIQFSYPQLFQDLNTNEIFTVGDTPEFPNTTLFRTLQRWMRQHTIPTPFLVGDKKINVPMRIGRGCLPWVNNHPQFKGLGMAVKTC